MPESRDRVERYVAIGDSQTEGLHDYHESGEPRGWADRFAEQLAADHPGLLYANLAVRGKRVREIREVQLEPALRMRPDLATVVGGINDVLKPRADVEAIAEELAAMYAPLVATGQMTFTIYIVQILVGGGDRAGLFDLLGFPPGEGVVAGWVRVAVFFSVTIFACHRWKQRFGRGPLELLMRRLCG